MSPSYHHAYIAGNLIAAFHKLKKFSVFSDLTLQIEGKDYIPDICLYPRKKMNFAAGDIIRMTEMPLVALEILSPSQGVQDVLDKFGIYFAAGIRSCWFVIPVSGSVIVYSEMEKSRTFHTGNIVDDSSDITISADEIFSE